MCSFNQNRPGNVTVKCLVALALAEIARFAREEIKFRVWCRQGENKEGRTKRRKKREERKQGNRESARNERETLSLSLSKDLLEEPTEEEKKDADRLIDFINAKRRKDSMVIVGKSTIPNAGLGLFADCDITESTALASSLVVARQQWEVES